jgi:hypothetical protein
LSGREVDCSAAPISCFNSWESRVETTDRDAAAIEIAQALQDFDSRRFSGPVGAEQAEDFAFLDKEADAADGLDVAVALDQVFDLQDRGWHGARLLDSAAPLGYYIMLYGMRHTRITQVLAFSVRWECRR